LVLEERSGVIVGVPERGVVVACPGDEREGPIREIIIDSDSNPRGARVGDGDTGRQVIGVVETGELLDRHGVRIAILP